MIWGILRKSHKQAICGEAICVKLLYILFYTICVDLIHSRAIHIQITQRILQFSVQDKRLIKKIVIFFLFVRLHSFFKLIPF